VKAVTGHEIGHYVLGHVWRGVIVISVMSILFFFGAQMKDRVTASDSGTP